MKYGLTGAFLTSIVLTFSVYATNWNSPDGHIALDIPLDGSLIEVRNPPAPATAMWNSADGQKRVIFIATVNPGNAALDKAGLEEGTLKQLPGGSIVSSSETNLSGIPVFTIEAVNNQGAYI